MKKIIIFNLIIAFTFNACFSEEKKVVTKKIKKEPVKYMVNKVKKIVDRNTTLSKIVQEDGIVVDGSRDEDLLDAFGLAVSKIMEEEGISVPDCSALAKTEFITKDECDEISDKYFGFYDIYTEDGVVKKVDDVFENGIVGEDIEIREGSVDFFDSSGNPLLDNQVEFEELVDENDDIELLRNLKSKIPKEKIEMLQKITQKLDFLKDKKEQEDKIQENINKNIKKEKVEKVIESNNKITIANDSTSNNEYKKSLSLYTAKSSTLRNLIAQHKQTDLQLQKEPNNQRIIDKYNKEELDISLLEQEVEMYKSEISYGN